MALERFDKVLARAAQIAGTGAGGVIIFTSEPVQELGSLLVAAFDPVVETWFALAQLTSALADVALVVLAGVAVYRLATTRRSPPPPPPDVAQELVERVIQQLQLLDANKGDPH